MKCWICGAEASTTNKRTSSEYIDGSLYFYHVPVSEHVRCYCEKCGREVLEESERIKQEYVRLKKKVMFENAITNLESQNIDLYKLKPAIDKVQKYVSQCPDKFDSSYEIIAAIILIDAGYQIQMQKKVLNYQVDIFIPSEHIILEIDGERHAHKKKYDSERDEAIKKELGDVWEIIRIETKYLDQDSTKLVKGIKGLRKYKATGKINWREI